MILKGATVTAQLEVPFTIALSPSGAPKTGYSFTLGDLQICPPGSNTFVNVSLANIVEKGFGEYVAIMTSTQAATAGKAYISFSASGYVPYVGSEDVIDQTTGAGVNVTQWLGAAALTPTTAGQPKVEVALMGANTLTATAVASAALTSAKFGNDVAVQAINTGTAGSVAAGTLNAAGTVATLDYYKGCRVYILSATTGAGQERIITSSTASTTSVLTLDRNWTVTPTGTVVYQIRAAEDLFQTAAAVTGNVGGNVVGSVASVTGNVGGNVVGSVASVTGAVGSVTGNVGGNVAGSVASVTGAVGSVTGNVGGNVVGSVASVAGNVGGNVVGSVASVTGAVGSVTGAVGSIGSGGITSTSIALAALTSAKFGNDVDVQVVNTGTAAAVAAGTITIASPVATTDYYKGCVVYVLSATTGVGQARTVTSNNTAGVLTLDRNWAVTPTGTIVYQVLPRNEAYFATIQADTDDVQSRLPAALVSGRMDSSTGAMAAGTITDAAFATTAITALGVVRRNTAQAGAASTITLDTGATVDVTNGIVYLVSGTGAGQFRSITAYNTSTKVATVDRAWGTTPDATSVFAIFSSGVASASGGGGPSAATIAAAVWDEASSGHVTAGTYGVGVPLTTVAASLVVSTLMAFSHDTGLTVKGAFRRMDALAAGAASGLLGSLAKFFMRDGSTAAISATQDTTLGSRAAANVAGSEA